MKHFNEGLAWALVSRGIMAGNAFAWVAFDTNPHTGTIFLGAVACDYGIGKSQVTREQYSGFMKPLGATGGFSLYNANTAANASVADIARRGPPGG